MAGMCFVVYARPLLQLLLVLQSFLCSICVWVHTIAQIYKDAHSICIYIFINPYIGRVSKRRWDYTNATNECTFSFKSRGVHPTSHQVEALESLSFQGWGDVCNGWLYGMANPLIYCCAGTLNRQQFSLINSLAAFGEYLVFVFGSNCNIQSRLHQFHKSWQLYCSLEDCLVKLV